MKNLHKAYYKDYFSKVDFSAADIDTKNNQDAIAAANATMTKAELFVIPAPIPELATFSCYISYPGLITGTGIAHETGIQGEFKLGLHFDYTYGMPVIYGSSVKGVLRNYFLDEYKEADAHIVLADIFDGQYSKHLDYLADTVFSTTLENKKYFADCVKLVKKKYIADEINRLSNEYTKEADNGRRSEIAAEIQRLSAETKKL